MTRSCSVRAHVRQAPAKPQVYQDMHHWLRVEVAMNEWAEKFPSGFPPPRPDAAEGGGNSREQPSLSASEIRAQGYA